MLRPKKIERKSVVNKDFTIVLVAQIYILLYTLTTFHSAYNQIVSPPTHTPLSTHQGQLPQPPYQTPSPPSHSQSFSKSPPLPSSLTTL
mmetsp:Transcript_45275/g.53014  ORF Transcript_45275/g.53014 Transcript_45275/m.53014 type:complete len:89 (+) Transcript_45275:43-309(+)